MVRREPSAVGGDSLSELPGGRFELSEPAAEGVAIAGVGSEPGEGWAGLADGAVCPSLSVCFHPWPVGAKARQHPLAANLTGDLSPARSDDLQKVNGGRRVGCPQSDRA